MKTDAAAGGRLLVFRLAAFVIALSCNAGLAFGADRLHEKMELLAGSRAPISIEADVIKYDRRSGVYTLTGHVVVSQGERTLTSDNATLEEKTGDAKAAGSARLVDRDNVLFAEKIEVNFNTKLGNIEEGSMFVKKENYHITGRSMRRVTEDEYGVVSGGMTTCDADLPAWRVTAGELKVRMDKDVRARDVVIRVKGVPVFYTPYAWFPLLKPRTTGFLLPSIGYSTKEGARLYNSFYWAPTDNFDATLSADYRSRRGVGIGTELRWAYDRDTITRLNGYYMDDRKSKRERWNLLLNHKQTLAGDIYLKADVRLSDHQYYRDLTETALDKTQRSVDSNAIAGRRWDWGGAYLFSQYTLSLDADNDFTVQRLPELGVNVVKMRIFNTPLYLDVDSSASYFHREKGVNAARFDLYSKVSGVFNLGGVNISPRFGYRETGYDMRGRERETYDGERGLVGFGVTAQTGFNRIYSFDSGPLAGLKHTVEPVVAYDFVQRRGGSVFPKFDGIDTLGRRNLLAGSLVNRFVVKYRGGGDKARVDYVTIRLSMYHDLNKDNLVSGRQRSLSNLFGEVVYKAGELFTVNNNFRFDPYEGVFMSVNTDVRVEDAKGRWHVSVGQRFSKDTKQHFMSPSRMDLFTPSAEFKSEFGKEDENEAKRLNFLTLEGGVKVGSKVAVSGRAWYDVHNQNFRETSVSVSYASQCWGVTASFTKRPGERQVMVMVNLKGLGNVKI